MNNFEYINELLPFYLSLLTKRQQDILTLYFYEDLSLSEIAENLEVTRNAVYDTIKKAEKILNEYEEKLHLNQNYKFRLAAYEKIKNSDKQQINKIIEELIIREEEIYE